MKSSTKVSGTTSLNCSEKFLKSFEGWKFAKANLFDKNSIFELLEIDTYITFFEHDPITGEMNFTDKFYKITSYDLGSITNFDQFIKRVDLKYDGLKEEVYEDFTKNEAIKSLEYEFQFLNKDGSSSWFSASCRKIWIPGMESYLFIGFFYDISYRKMVEIELSEKSSLYDIVFTGDKEAFYQHDPFDDTMKFSDSFYHMLGYEIGSFPTFTKFSEIVVDKDLAKLHVELDRIIESEDVYFRFEEGYRKKDGSEIWVVTRTKKVWLPGASNFILVGMLMDVTERKEAEEKLHNLAYFDTTTGMPNRTYFNEQLESVTKERLSGYLIFLDIDDFKNINDIYGHAFGDKVLKGFSNRLKSCLPPGSFVGRLSGDEFAAIIYTDSFDEISEITDNALKIMQSSYSIAKNKIFITFSLGIVNLNEETTEEATLLVMADIAMYEAKSKGKNQKSFYNSNTLKRIIRESKIEEALRTAVANDELSCVYQPIFDAKTREIYSFESLLRFNSKKLGFVSPAEFIPIAERSGQILEIGQYGIFKAAKKVAEWIDKGYKFKKMNINVSCSDLQSKTFKEGLTKVAEEIGVPLSKINVEVTETELLEFQDEVIEHMRGSIVQGVNFSLDDFGTGFSSFRYLSETYFSSLKIDMVYVQRITKSEQDEKLVRNLIHLAHVLDMKVVAEGVETKEQYDLLIEMDVDYVQGFYLSQPLSADEAEELLRSRSK